MLMESILAGLFVFAMRVADMSLDTLRLLFMMRGRKALAGLIGAAQAAVFILAVSQVLKGELNFWTVLGYAAGFGAGVVLGMLAEERLAIGAQAVRRAAESAAGDRAGSAREAVRQGLTTLGQDVDREAPRGRDDGVD